MRRAKKTVEKNNDISKTRDDLDYTKVCAGWNTEFSTAWTISDEEAQKILGELNTTPITVVPDSDCMTGKVASIDSNTIFATSTPGMVIVHNRKAMFVIEVGDSGITVVDPQAGEEKKILPTKNCFNFNFYTRVVSLFDSFMKSSENAPSAENPFGNMLPFFMMNENSGEFDMNTMLMLSMMGGQSGMDFSKNPMMMYFLMKDSKNADDLLPLMFMSNLCK